MLWAARLHPDDREVVLERAAESERDGVPFEMEYRYLARDGRVVWVRDSAVLIERTPDGRPWRFQGVMMDVTETREAQRRVAEAERRSSRCASASAPRADGSGSPATVRSSCGSRAASRTVRRLARCV